MNKTKIERLKPRVVVRRRPPPLPLSKGQRTNKRIRNLLDDGFTFDATNAWSFEK